MSTNSTPPQSPQPSVADLPAPVLDDATDAQSTSAMTIDKAAEATYLALLDRWEMRATQAHGRPEQVPTLTEDEHGEHYRAASLYYGGDAASLRPFMQADDSMIGDGLPLVGEPAAAFEQALRRALPRRKVGDAVVTDGDPPTVWALELVDANLLDARDDQVMVDLMQGFAEYLRGWRDSVRQSTDLAADDQAYLELVEQKLKLIDDSAGRLATIWQIADNAGSILRDYVISIGYDGMIAGPPDDAEIQVDIWLLMRPEVVRVTDEVTFDTPVILTSDETGSVPAH